MWAIGRGSKAVGPALSGEDLHALFLLNREASSRNGSDVDYEEVYMELAVGTRFRCFGGPTACGGGG